MTPGRALYTPEEVAEWPETCRINGHDHQSPTPVAFDAPVTLTALLDETLVCTRCGDEIAAVAA